MAINSEGIEKVAGGFVDSLLAPACKKGGRVIDRVIDAMSESELDQMNRLGSAAHKRDSVGLAELFSRVASRARLEDELCGLVPLDDTNNKLVGQLHQVGATSFAKLVGEARRKHGM